jgi:hypothetical protein
MTEDPTAKPTQEVDKPKWTSKIIDVDTSKEDTTIARSIPKRSVKMYTRFRAE